jgi:NadR type nicotinamide-nucleotide adenylyltransferase
MTGGRYLICLYGPESTGKTTLAQQLAARFNTRWVPEVARELIDSSRFTAADIERIAAAQAARTQQLIPLAHRVLFCDSDLITTQIYAQHYLGMVPPLVFDLQKTIQYAHYFLFDIDVPWVADGLRELGHCRPMMLQRFETELKNRRLDYTWVRGIGAERLRVVENELAKRFGLMPEVLR